MQQPNYRPLALLALMGTCAATSAQAQQASEVRSDQKPSVTPENFTELRDLVLPTEDELIWKRLNWRTSLWEGVIEAHSSKKPILLWAMNGHPLGCT